MHYPYQYVIQKSHPLASACAITNSRATVKMTQQLPPERRYALYTFELTDPTVRISATCFGSGCFSSTEFILCNPQEEQYNYSPFQHLLINMFIF